MISNTPKVLSFSNNDYNFLIENCLFLDCKCTSNTGGGSLSITLSTLGSLILNKLCIFNCSTGNSNGQFGYFSIPKNHIDDSISISKCKSIGGMPIHILQGFQNVININSSLNNLNVYSGFYLQHSTNSNLTFSTIINNSCSLFICVEFQYSTSNLLYSNIIGNNSPNYGIVTASIATIIIENTIFNKNSNKLLSLYSTASIYISNCWIDHPSNSYGIIISSNINYFTFRNSYKFTHFISNFCEGNLNNEKTIINNFKIFYFKLELIKILLII